MHLHKDDFKDIGAAIGAAADTLRKRLNELEETSGLTMRFNMEIFVYVDHDVPGEPSLLLTETFRYEEKGE